MYISFARVLKLYFLFIELLKFPSLLFYRDYTETRRTTETISIQIIAWLEQIKVLEIFQAFERKNRLASTSILQTTTFFDKYLRHQFQVILNV